jgi:hypothetical protein
MIYKTLYRKLKLGKRNLTKPRVNHVKSWYYDELMPGCFKLALSKRGQR